MIILPKISVITAVYNAEDTICDTLTSIIKIKKYYSNLEIIVIDGASSDKTIEIINSKSREITSFISEPDDGIYHAMNKGITRATGDWLIFMNSGDLFSDDSFTFFQNFIKKLPFKENVMAIYGNTKIKNTEQTIRILSSEISKQFFYSSTICHQSIFFNKKVFESIQNLYSTNYKIISDKELLLKIELSNGKFYHIDHNLCVWDDVGFSTKNMNVFIEEDRRFKNEYFNLFERLCFGSMIKLKVLFKNYLN